MSIVCGCGGDRLKLMWDWEGTGLWCAACHRPVDPGGLPLPDGLARRVVDWNRRCALLGQRALRGGADRAAWEALQAEARELQRELDRYVPTYLYQLLSVPLPEPRCPGCGRRLLPLGRAGAGFAAGACEECQLWIAYPEPGPG